MNSLVNGTTARLRPDSGTFSNRPVRIVLGRLVMLLATAAFAAEQARSSLDPATLARTVTIYRDDFGTPHIDGADDASVVFGFAYAQAEDYFWQIEDSYILSIGRYAEILGTRGLNSDLLNHAFEIVSRSQRDYDTLEPDVKILCEAYVAGLNYYLATHPEVKPRMITRFEPWQVLAFGRHLTLEMSLPLHAAVEQLHAAYNPVDSVGGGLERLGDCTLADQVAPCHAAGESAPAVVRLRAAL